MTWEIYFVFALLIFAIVSFIWERISADLTAITVFGVLIFVSMISKSEELPNLESMLGVFGNSAPLTIAAMFIVSGALERTGAIDLITSYLRRMVKLPYRSFIFIMVIGVAGVSAFINNTPVVIVLMPVVLTLSREMGIASSKLLIPLSYASIFGGTCTLLGTSTNLLASGILVDSGHEPIGMFELAAVGLPILAFGSLYLVLFGNKLLPHRETLTSILSDEERKEFMTEAFVRLGSELKGQTALESGMLKGRGIRLLEIVRHGVAVKGDPKRTKLEIGDRLVLACRPSGVAEANSIKGIALHGEISAGLETIAMDEGAIVEGVVGPHATILGKTLGEINFRQRFRMVVVAVHRKGHNQRDRLDSLRLQPGDTLLMMGSTKAINSLSTSEEIILLDRPRLPARSVRAKMPIAIAVTTTIVTLATLNLVPIVAAVTLGVAILMLTGCVKPKDAYASVEWSILMIIFGMLALGQAMDSTGASLMIAENMIGLVQSFAPEHLQNVLMLAFVYIITSTFTEFLSNNAAVALMVPIALGIAATLGIDPRPFVVGACIAASASFATPIGYQTNTYVYGVGGYRFFDFTKVGLPLNIICFIVTVAVVPRFWSF
ncbi:MULTISPECIES: SLC13 family permease [unclassified Lentimonas]|uniref:SLC13 family permease n=1 Tax=unclassified Lentimonas TaxID=2630993 RepID=UPI0013225225|nr:MULTISPECIES: SLC13 family permease [unclassified Lentimonas]CAA6680068.1 Sulfate permease, Trk-type [Lentimonas sp. CC4]CAA6685048.1 Sulfate permease, Trk-type [Lentimonas sp. CC6]CAA6691411.1 Sulfate permease, Trk-type [Lentimonas sp. CC10]CAA6693151.1 Sulfate permease, Trk-type [Lentimonas sp. CC19]CAA7068967.1 Sulfate permease, Trk-type [Lentimonas sp. CC11]